MSNSRDMPSHSVIMPGSPSFFRPRKPPSFAIFLTTPWTAPLKSRFLGGRIGIRINETIKSLPFTWIEEC